MSFENVKLVLNSIFYSFENHFTLGPDNVAEASDEMMLSESDINMKSSNDDNDDHDCDKFDDDTFTFNETFSIENKKEDAICNELSLEYIANVVNLSDATDKKTHGCRSVQCHFKSVKERSYIRRLRIHIANDGIKL